MVLDLKSEDRFTIKNRGIVYTVRLPEEYVKQFNPRNLVDQQVIIDGKEYIIKGVEMFAIAWTPGSTTHQRIGLLVHEH